MTAPVRRRQTGPPLLGPALAFAALTVVGLVLGAAGPRPTTSATDVAAYLAGNQLTATVLAWAVFAASIPLAVFSAVAYRRLRMLGVTAPGPALGLAGGGLASAALALSGRVGWGGALRPFSCWVRGGWSRPPRAAGRRHRRRQHRARRACGTARAHHAGVRRGRPRLRRSVRPAGRRCGGPGTAARAAAAAAGLGRPRDRGARHAQRVRAADADAVRPAAGGPLRWPDLAGRRRRAAAAHPARHSRRLSPDPRRRETAMDGRTAAPPHRWPRPKPAAGRRWCSSRWPSS